MNGGLGDDVLVSGDATDYFIFGSDAGFDRIKGFQDGTDLIDFRGSGIVYDDLSFVAKGGGADTLIQVAGFDVEIFVEDMATTDFTFLDFFWQCLALIC